MRSGILIKNACVITGAGPVFPSGCIHISNGEIAAVGPESDSRTTHDARRMTVLDACGRYVLPGFINPHMHFYGALSRGMPVRKMRKFSEVLKGLWWPLDQALSLDDIYISALSGGIEAVKSGVTTVFDHHASYGAINGSLSAISRALFEINMRASLCFEISDRNGKKARDAALRESAKWLDGVQTAAEKNPHITRRGMVGLHASMTLSDETLGLARELMEIYGVGAHVHVAEGGEDVAITKKSSRMTPVARLAKAGILDGNSLAAHCVHVSDNDIGLLKKSGVAVVHNPLSNLNNAVGIAPVLEFECYGIPVAIGTDGMSAGISGDVRLASVIHKIESKNAQGGADICRSVWKTAPRLASKQFGMDVGVIRKGALADIIIIDANPPTEVTGENAWWHVIFGVLNAPVRTTIIGGKIAMEDFQVAGVDEKFIAAEAQKLAKKLWRRI